MTNTLPIDDIRHCPLGLRISDAPIKTNNNRMYSGLPAKKKKPRSGKKQYVHILGAFLDGKEVHRGTYRELQDKLSIPINSLRNYAFRGHKNKDTGFTFKKVGEFTK